MVLSALTLLLQVSTTAPAGPAADRATDARVLRDAKTAQVRFESIRRMHLPRGGFSSEGRCDVRIGRFCYWYDTARLSVVPEPKRIAAERSRLLTFLDSMSALDPSDAWLVGQRIRYRIEAGQADSAAAVARQCAAEPWWCAALLGLALHVSQRYDSANAAFDAALRRMPDAQRCAWHDLGLVLNGRLASEISRSSCEDRVRLADRLWFLGQPLWSTVGADLRAEHFARLTMAAIFERSANAHGMSWGYDNREVLLRYGWAEWFTRRDPEPAPYHSSPGVTGHDREPSYFFFPDVPSARTTPRITSSTWRLRDALARSRYAPRHVSRLSDLPHQLVRFPRGDSMLIAVRYAISDTALVRDSLASSLATYHRDALRLHTPRRRVLVATAPSDTLIVSVEVHGERSRVAARARYTIDPLLCRGAWCPSDLLLFDAPRGDNEPDLESALTSAHTSMRLSTRRPLSVLWQIQGVPATPLMWLSLAVEPLHEGVARRVATRLRLVRPRDAVRLRWQAPMQSALQTQSTTLRLPSGARGKYRVILTVQPAGVTALTTSREVELVP